MNVVLWAAQMLVAAVFLFSAVTKGTWSKEKLLAKGQTGVRPIPLRLNEPRAALQNFAILVLCLSITVGRFAQLT